MFYLKSNHKKYLAIPMLIIMLAGIFLYLSKGKGSTAQTGANETVQFAIYTVKYDENLPRDAALDQLTLEDTPILTNKDIKKYDWTNNKLLLKDEVEMPSAITHASFGKFVVVVNGERLYSGSFHSILSPSFPPKGAVLFGDERNKTVTITFSGTDKDPRSDKRVYDVFSKLGKLRR